MCKTTTIVNFVFAFFPINIRYTKISDVILSAFIYRLFHEDFSLIIGDENVDKITSEIFVHKALH